MFETIKEFEDYIFSIETEEQLQQAKYGEADVLAYYESLGDRARAQIYKDLSMKSGKESVLNRKYDFQEMAKGFMENLNDLGSFFASIGEKFMPEIHRSQLGKYPLVRTILSNYMNMNDAGGALLSIVNDIGTQIETMPEISDEKFDAMLDELEKNPHTKDLAQKLNDAINSIEIDEDSDEEPKSESNKKEIDPIRHSVVNSKWFRKAIDKDFITEEANQYKWLGTKGELALFAELLSEELNLKYKWQPFEDLFGYKNLANAKWKTKEIRGYAGNRENDILSIFNKK